MDCLSSLLDSLLVSAAIIRSILQDGQRDHQLLKSSQRANHQIRKKAFAWFKKRQSQQSQQSGQSQGQQSYGQQQQSYGQQQQQPYQQNNQQYSGYAGAAGHAGNDYNQQQSQNWNQPPPQNQYQNQNQNVQHGMNGVKPNHGKYDDNMVSR